MSCDFFAERRQTGCGSPVPRCQILVAFRRAESPRDAVFTGPRYRNFRLQLGMLKARNLLMRCCQSHSMLPRPGEAPQPLAGVKQCVRTICPDIVPNPALQIALMLPLPSTVLD